MCQTADHLRKASEETLIHASSSSMVNKWDVHFGPTVTAHLRLKEAVCLPWRGPFASLQPPRPERPCYQNPTAGGWSNCSCHRPVKQVYSCTCLSLPWSIFPCHDPSFPLPTQPLPLNTHRGPINPIMQMQVINRAAPPFIPACHHHAGLPHHLIKWEQQGPLQQAQEKSMPNAF